LSYLVLLKWASFGPFISLSLKGDRHLALLLSVHAFLHVCVRNSRKCNSSYNVHNWWDFDKRLQDAFPYTWLCTKAVTCSVEKLWPLCQGYQLGHSSHWPGSSLKIMFNGTPMKSECVTQGTITFLKTYISCYLCFGCIKTYPIWYLNMQSISWQFSEILY